MDFIEERLFDGLLLPGTSGGPRWSTTITAMQSGREQRQVNWSRQRARYEIGSRVVDRQELELFIRNHYVCQGMAIGFRWQDLSDCDITRADSLLKPMGDGRSYQLHKVYSFGGLSRERKVCKPVPGTFELWINGNPSTAYTIDTTTGIVQLNATATSVATNVTGGGTEFQIGATLYDAVAVGNVLYINGTSATVTEKVAPNRLRVSSTVAVVGGASVVLYPQNPALEAVCEFDVPVRFDTDEPVHTYAGGTKEDPLFDLASVPIVELKL